MKPTFTGIIPLPIGKEPESRITYTLDNVPFPPSHDPEKAPGGLRPPQGGLTVIHGQRIGMVALAQVRAMLAESKLQGVPIYIEAEESGAKSLYTPQDLPGTKILHLDRLDKKLRDQVINFMDQYAKAEGTPYPWPKKRRAVDELEIIMNRPHLIANLLHEKGFKHLQIICYPINAGGQMTRRGTIFRRKAIKQIYSTYYPNIKLKLPTWLK